MNEAGDKVGAIIAAAGSSRRMGGTDKIFADLAGKPLLSWVVEVFESCPMVAQTVIVLSQGNVERGRRLAAEWGWAKVVGVCPGGSRRQDSVREGLKRLSACDWVIVHDGARPCVTVDLLERGLEAARETGAAIAAVPVKDTIKVVDSSDLIVETPARHTLWAAQTPQIFRYDIIWKAYSQPGGEVTDDAALVEASGYKVKVYPGSHLNIKVTTPEDLMLAEAILRSRECR